MSVRDHLDAFHRALDRLDYYGFAESIDINEETRASKQAVIKAAVVLVDLSVLQLTEYIDARLIVPQKVCFRAETQGRREKPILILKTYLCGLCRFA